VTHDDLPDDPEAVAWIAQRATQSANSPHAAAQDRQAPFSIFRLHWWLLLRRAKAKSAAELLSAVAYQMAMDQTDRTAITETTWARMGGRTRDERKTMLRALHRVPDIVQLKFSRRMGSKYAAHKGRWFDQAPPHYAKGVVVEFPTGRKARCRNRQP
jgi:hypothetical protein